MFLRMCREDVSVPTAAAASTHPLGNEVAVALRTFWRDAPALVSFRRFDHLKNNLLAELESKDSVPGGFRGVLFVEQRVTTHIIAYFIESDDTLHSRFNTACLYATSSPATASLSVSASQAKTRIAAFADGSVNLLIATVVAEEGMDVPAANVVIRFDAMVHGVSFVQGRGRARQADSSYVVMSERSDRTVATLAKTEKTQLEIVRRFKPCADTGARAAAQRVAQPNRERVARALLEKVHATAMAAKAVALLNSYAKQTKVDLQTNLAKDKEKAWQCEIFYDSVLRVSVCGVGRSASKAEAKRAAALCLLKKLHPTSGGDSPTTSRDASLSIAMAADHQRRSRPVRVDPRRALHVGGLLPHVTDDHLRSSFAEVGAKALRISRHAKGASVQFCFVEFPSEEEAERVFGCRVTLAPGLLADGGVCLRLGRYTGGSSSKSEWDSSISSGTSFSASNRNSCSPTSHLPVSTRTIPHEERPFLLALQAHLQRCDRFTTDLSLLGVLFRQHLPNHGKMSVFLENVPEVEVIPRSTPLDPHHRLVRLVRLIQDPASSVKTELLSSTPAASESSSSS
eukprot:TRINITY_DN2993_c1_g1_i1.p1 TRINITY_DN2993_c1_g1~~TRINITY_DN2993_c1_g1_i1.p1  ORF type:complete len:570 (+),score=130.25 TRINITY_DN2993_c1_g1_i1:885-2594(+)